MSDSILLRKREIGIRMALGAQSSNVLLFIARGEMSSVLVGECIGFALSLGVLQEYAHFLYYMRGFDLSSIAITLLIVSSITLTACLFPYCVPRERACAIFCWIESAPFGPIPGEFTGTLPSFQDL